MEIQENMKKIMTGNRKQYASDTVLLCMIWKTMKLYYNYTDYHAKKQQPAANLGGKTRKNVTAYHF